MSLNAIATAVGPEPVVDALEPTPAAMRRSMGAFASGVTVVTALDDEEPVGFACQSFASLSLEPPLVLFCAGREGRSWARVRRAGMFCVNVLGEDQVDVCGRFGSRDGKRFEGLSWERSSFGAPVLPGAVLRVHCVLETVHPGGDHDIAVGRVLGLELQAEGRPLVFHRGRFGLDEPRRGASYPWGLGDRWG